MTMGEIPAEYELNEPEPKPRQPVNVPQLVLTIAGFTGTLCVALFALAGVFHANGTSAFQAKKIQNLDTSNTRLAAENAALSMQLSQLSARLSAADPSSDASLVTCSDLRQMRLTVITGGSVSSVPGSVSLSQSAVALPAHCKR
jgi:hypothetical protein